MSDGPSSAFVTGGSGFIGGRLVARLRADGWRVRALARSERSRAVVERLGAEAVAGDLDDVAAMEAGARGCEVVFHLAARLPGPAPWREFERDNVVGTRNVVEACRRVGASRLVHASTEAVLLAGAPLHHADEHLPRRPDSPAPYAATKAQAEEVVERAAEDELIAVNVRPRFVWGAGDTSLLPSFVEASRSGRLRWIGGGRHRTSTTHVLNAVEGLVLAAERGLSGRAYFVTDGEPVVFREFVSALLATQGVEPPQRELPAPAAAALAVLGEAAWRVLPLPGGPPLTRFELWIASQECTLDDGRARRELGYRPVCSREAGLAELRRSAVPPIG